MHRVAVAFLLLVGCNSTEDAISTHEGSTDGGGSEGSDVSDSSTGSSPADDADPPEDGSGSTDGATSASDPVTSGTEGAQSTGEATTSSTGGDEGTGESTGTSTGATEDASGSTSHSDSTGATGTGMESGSSGEEPCVAEGCPPDSCGFLERCGEFIYCGVCFEPLPVEQLQPEHAIADASRGRIYATVSGAAPVYANHLVVIDPGTATVVDAVYVGSNPSSLAISDDDSTLWVGIDGANEVREVDLTGIRPLPGDSHNLPLGAWGDLTHAGDMVVLPGTTTSLAISLHRTGVSPSFAGVTILDEGVPRPDMTAGHTGAAQLTGGPEGWLFGYNDLSTGYNFYAIAVTVSGPDQAEHPSPLSGFDTDILYAGQRIYATSGQVVDVSDPTHPEAAGVFAWSGAIALHDASGLVFMLSPPDFGEATATLRRLDPQTFTQIDFVEFGVGDVDEFDDLVTADGETFAVVARTRFEPSRLFVFDSPFATP